MICRCFGLNLDLAAAGRTARQTALLMLGVPDYDAYLAHFRSAHPDRTPPNQAEFFTMRQQAQGRAGGNLRCC